MVTKLAAVTSLVWTVVVTGGQVDAGKPGCGGPAFIPHGSGVVEFEGIQVRYTCDWNYLPVGHTVALCAGKNWDEPPPVCVTGGCHDLEKIRHGEVTYSHERGRAVVTCHEGFTLIGSSVLSCDGRKWNATQPRCHASKKNEKPQSDDGKLKTRKVPLRSHEAWLKKADYTCTTMPPRGVNTHAHVRWALVQTKPRMYATYRCKWGFEPLGGSKHMYCQKKQWLGHLPRCVTSPPEPTPEGQADWTGPSSTLSHDAWLLRADYSCLGYVGAPRTSGPPHIAHARSRLRYAARAGSPRLYALYECKHGFHLLNNYKYMYCYRESWIGTTPQCVDIKKTPHKTVNPCEFNNGGCSHVCVWAQGSLHAQCACRAGYTLMTDKAGCQDLDECKSHNGGCGQHPCVNTEGSFRCDCVAGYVQGPDGQLCVKKSRYKTTPLRTLTYYHH